MARCDLGYPGGAPVHAQASRSLMRVQTMHLLNVQSSGGRHEAKISPDRSRGILIASALAVASFGIGTGADARITQIVVGSPTAPF